MALTFEVGERFRDAAAEWGESRMMDESDALETKVEQALLEIEHLISGRTEVAFDVDGGRVDYEPSEALAAFLAEQAERSGLDESEVLNLHVDLFARVFLDSDDR